MVNHSCQVWLERAVWGNAWLGAGGRFPKFRAAHAAVLLVGGLREQWVLTVMVPVRTQVLGEKANEWQKKKSLMAKKDLSANTGRRHRLQGICL